MKNKKLSLGYWKEKSPRRTKLAARIKFGFFPYGLYRISRIVSHFPYLKSLSFSLSVLRKANKWLDWFNLFLFRDYYDCYNFLFT